MEPFLIVLPLFLALLVVFYGVVHSLLRVWLDYRVRLKFLDKLEKNPDLMQSTAGAQSLFPTPEGGVKAVGRQDFAVTGLALGCIGLVCVVAGRTLRVGQLAVGAYLGGVMCVVLGIILGLLGLLIRAMARDPIARLGKHQ